MLGGAARGTFALLDGSDASFETHYRPLRDFLRTHTLDGLDLDIEEPMSLASVVRLIDRLRADFGPGFLITLAPVAMALVMEGRVENYAEFSYGEWVGGFFGLYGRGFQDGDLFCELVVCGHVGCVHGAGRKYCCDILNPQSLQYTDATIYPQKRWK